MENVKKWFLQTAAQLQPTISEKMFHKGSAKSKNVKLASLAPDSFSTNHNITDMKIVSPFYDRSKVCKNSNCSCPYHRRLRYLQVKKLKFSPKIGTQTMQQSPRQFCRTSSQVPSRYSYRTSIQSPTEMENKVKPKLTKIVRFASDTKIDDHNEAYQQFLKMSELFLLKKMHYTEEDLHKIRQSVPQIFKFIFKNLEKPVQFVRQHLNQMLKDRNITQIYVERFIELKEKKYGRKAHGKSRTSALDIKANQLKKSAKKYTELRQSNSKMSNRSSVSSKGSKKLIIKKMIKDVQSGYEVDSQKIIKLVNEDVDKFAQNCQYLNKVVHKFDAQTLIEIRQGILIRAKKSFWRQNQENKAKKEELDKAVEMINNRIQQLEKQDKKDNFTIRSHDSNMSRASYRTNHRSSARSKRSLFKDQLNLNAEKSGFRPEKSRVVFEKQDDNLVKRKDNPKAQTIFREAQIMIPKKQNLNKYRRLSHDLFFRKRKGTDQNESVHDTIRRMQINSIKEINDHLDALGDYVLQKHITIKELQLKISNANLKTLVAKEEDSLLTAKRKARAFKNLLKEELPNQVKDQISEYVDILNKKNYAKNRKWAYQVIKNMVLTSNEVEIIAGEDVDVNDFKNFVDEFIQENIPQKARLLFYNLNPTKYEEKEMNFQKNLFDFMRSKQEEDDSRRKRTEYTRQKTRIKNTASKQEAEEAREDELIQIGLTSHCQASCFGLNPFSESQREPTTGGSDFEEPPKRSEASYFQLYEKLLNLHT